MYMCKHCNSGRFLTHLILVLFDVHLLLSNSLVIGFLRSLLRLLQKVKLARVTRIL